MADADDLPELDGDLDDLDALVRRGDPDRWLASRLIADPQARADVVTLLAYDLELARAPRRASNALIGEIRLTWWREALDEIYGGGVVRRHPTALALAEVVARHGFERAPLEAMIDARYVELDKRPLDPAELSAWTQHTAGAVARLSARVLDPHGPTDSAATAASAWALAQAVRLKLTDEATGRAALQACLRDHRRAPPLSAAAFPAGAVGALAASVLAKTPPSELGKRARLLWSALRGRA